MGLYEWETNLLEYRNKYEMEKVFYDLKKRERERVSLKLTQNTIQFSC